MNPTQRPVSENHSDFAIQRAWEQADQLRLRVWEGPTDEVDHQIQQLARLAHDFRDSYQIVDEYAMALIAVAGDLPLDQARQALATNRRLASQWPGNVEVNSSLGATLAVLIGRSSSFDAKPLITELLALADSFQHCAELDWQWSRGLRGAIEFHQVDIGWAVAWLRAIAYRHSEVRRIVEGYLRTLNNLIRDDPAAAPAFKPLLEEFIADHPDYRPLLDTLTKPQSSPVSLLRRMLNKISG